MSAAIYHLPNAFALRLHPPRVLKGRAPKGVTRLTVFRRERERAVEAEKVRAAWQASRDLDREARILRMAELVYARSVRLGKQDSPAEALLRVRTAFDDMRERIHAERDGAA